MLTRIVTGTLAAAVALAAILWREPWAFLLLTLLALGTAVREVLPFVRKAPVVSAPLFIFACGIVAPPPYLDQNHILRLGLSWLIGSVSLILWKPNNFWTLSLLSWIVSGLAVAVVARLFVPLDWAWVHFSLLLLILLPLWVGDSLAYFVGKAFGKHKLAPSISPNKTWEGAVANLVGCLAAAYAIGIWLKVPLQASIAVGLTTGILGQVGDLLQSRLKRLAEVKDSGSILPGHGGVLDRLDSFLFSSYPSLLALYLLAPETFHVKQWPW